MEHSFKCATGRSTQAYCARCCSYQMYESNLGNNLVVAAIFLGRKSYLNKIYLLCAPNLSLEIRTAKDKFSESHFVHLCTIPKI